MAEIEVKIGDLVVMVKPGILRAAGVGSCVIITFFDPINEIAGCAHPMLPSYPLSGSAPDDQNLETLPAMHYVDKAIEELKMKMLTQGARINNLEAKLIGGANMFSAFKSDIGERNVTMAREIIKKEGIKLIGESVGGSQGRSVEFSSTTGLVAVKMFF